MELRLYNIPDAAYQQIAAKSAELNMSPSEYAKTLLLNNTADQEKIIQKLIEKYDNFDLKKAAELKLHEHRLRQVVGYYQREVSRLMEQLDQYKLNLETMNLIARFSDVVEMLRTYITSVPEDKELVQQLLDEFKALNDRCDEISLLQKIKLKKQFPKEANP